MYILKHIDFLFISDVVYWLSSMEDEDLTFSSVTHTIFIFPPAFIVISQYGAKLIFSFYII